MQRLAGEQQQSLAVASGAEKKRRRSEGVQGMARCESAAAAARGRA
jgi:hypothetical protein